MKKKNRWNKIGQKIWVSSVAISIVVILLTVTCCAYFANTNALRISMNDLSEKATVIARLAGRSGGLVHLATSGWLHDLESLSGAQIIYVDTDMNASYFIVNATSTTPEEFKYDDLGSSPIKDSVDREMLETIFSGEAVNRIQNFSLTGSQTLLSGHPVYATETKDGEIVGAVIMCRSVDEVKETVINSVWILVAAAAASLLFSVVAARRISRRITKPILALNDAALRMVDDNCLRISDEELNMGSCEIQTLGRTLLDLSERLQRSVRLLADEKCRLELILQSIGEGIVAVDLNGNLIHRNAAYAELLDSGCFTRSEGYCILKPLMDKALVESGHYRTVWSGNKVDKIQADIYSVRNSTGEIIGSVALVRDITESAKLEQMRKDYIANISHELRTPLTGIRGMIEPLIDDILETEAEKQNSYNVIYHETVRLQKLITDMLEMSRLQDNKVVINVEEIEICGLCRLVVENAAMNPRSSATPLELVLPYKELLCQGNGDRIEQVLIILLDNARSFTPEDGKITVFAREEDTAIAFGVADTGCGIAADDLPYIWDRFYKVDKSRLRTSGTGLGLAIAKMAVEHMNGTIEVQSTLGKGSCFTIRLPKEKRADV